MCEKGTFSQIRSHILGLQQLYAGQPTVAFTSLLEAVQVFQSTLVASAG